MSLATDFRSRLLAAAFGLRAVRVRRRLAEWRRRLGGRRHVVSVFLQLDDPYSYLLSHYLPELAAKYDVDLRLYFSEAIGGDYQPLPAMQAEYAILDCSRLAAELGIPFLDKGQLPPTEHRAALSDAVATFADSADFEQPLFEAL